MTIIFKQAQYRSDLFYSWLDAIDMELICKMQHKGFTYQNKLFIEELWNQINRRGEKQKIVLSEKIDQILGFLKQCL